MNTISTAQCRRSKEELLEAFLDDFQKNCEPNLRKFKWRQAGRMEDLFDLWNTSTFAESEKIVLTKIIINKGQFDMLKSVHRWKNSSFVTALTNPDSWRTQYFLKDVIAQPNMTADENCNYYIQNIVRL